MFNGHRILIAMSTDGAKHQFCRYVRSYGGEPPRASGCGG